MSAAKAASLAINHVGICVFARSDVQDSVLDLPTYKSFELLPLNVRHGTLSFVLVVIYDQTLASSALSVNDEFFFVVFARVLERTSSFADCMIVGDGNVHLDDATTAQVIQLVSLLDGYGLYDVIRQPTHLRGHRLDVFITHTDQPIASVRVNPPLLSNNSLITVAFNTLSVKQTSENMPVWYRR